MFAMTPLAWLAIGLILVAAEIVIPGFIIFWFGLGGIVTAFFSWMGLLKGNSAQSAFFFTMSFAFVAIWFLFLKKIFYKDGKHSDFRDPTLMNIRGKITKEVKLNIPGEIELFTPFHGISKWKAESEEEIPAGTEVRVVEARGIVLLVTRK